MKTLIALGPLSKLEAVKTRIDLVCLTKAPERTLWLFRGRELLLAQYAVLQ